MKQATREQTHKTETEKPKKKKRVMGLKRLEAEVKRVLMQLMSESQSDAVRVAAAKALMDKINKQQEEGGDDVQHDEATERSAAVAEARELLAELAALKSARASRKGTVA